MNTTSPDNKGREFDIARDVAELLDTLPIDQQRQIMAMLGTRYGLKLIEPTSGQGRGYSRPYPGKKPRAW